MAWLLLRFVIEMLQVSFGTMPKTCPSHDYYLIASPHFIYNGPVLVVQLISFLASDDCCIASNRCLQVVLATVWNCQSQIIQFGAGELYDNTTHYRTKSFFIR